MRDTSRSPWIVSKARTWLLFKTPQDIYIYINFKAMRWFRSLDDKPSICLGQCEERTTASVSKLVSKEKIGICKFDRNIQQNYRSQKGIFRIHFWCHRISETSRLQDFHASQQLNRANIIKSDKYHNLIVFMFFCITTCKILRNPCMVHLFAFFHDLVAAQLSQDQILFL